MTPSYPIRNPLWPLLAAAAVGCTPTIHSDGTTDAASATSVSVTAAQIIAALGYTPANRAGDTFTGVLLGPSGSAAAPAYAFSAEPGLGLYRAGAATLAATQAATDSTPIFRLRSSDDSAYFQVVNDHNAGVVQIDASRGLEFSYGGQPYLRLGTGGDYHLGNSQGGLAYTSMDYRSEINAGLAFVGTEQFVGLRSQISNANGAVPTSGTAANAVVGIRAELSDNPGAVPAPIKQYLYDGWYQANGAGASSKVFHVDHLGGAFFGGEVELNGITQETVAGNLELNRTGLGQPIYFTPAAGGGIGFGFAGRIASVADDIAITPKEGGGVGKLQVGRRISDSNAAVGASLEVWTATLQAEPALVIRSPGGAADLSAFLADGSLGVGTPTPTQRLEVAGNILVNGTANTCTLGDGPGAVMCSSDAREKNDIRTIENALARVAAMRGVTFRRRDPRKNRDDGLPWVGVIAQEVRAQFPEAVTANHRGPAGAERLSVDYASLVGPLIEAVKELKTRVEALEAENRRLRGASGR